MLTLVAILTLGQTPETLLKESLERSAVRRHTVVVAEATVPKVHGCRLQRVANPQEVDHSGTERRALEGTTPEGGPCKAIGWAKVHVSAKAYVLTRDVKAGEPLQDAVEEQIVDRKGTSPLVLDAPTEGIAAFALKAGTALEQRHVKDAKPGIGDAVPVRVLIGTLTLEQKGVVLGGCRAQLCARLPNGHRVEGRWHHGALEVSP